MVATTQQFTRMLITVISTSDVMHLSRFIGLSVSLSVSKIRLLEMF